MQHLTPNWSELVIFSRRLKVSTRKLGQEEHGSPTGFSGTLELTWPLSHSHSLLLRAMCNLKTERGLSPQRSSLSKIDKISECRGRVSQ